MMSRTLSSLLAVLISLVSISPLRGADDAPRTVEIEIVIADQSHRKPDDGALDLALKPNEIVDQVRRLEQEGRIDVRYRARLSTLNQLPATLQTGEQTPVPVSRNTLPGGRGARTSFANQQFGVMISLTPRVVEGGDVLVELNIERSRMVAVTKLADDDGSFTPPGTSTLTTQTTVRVPDGKTVVVSAASQTDGEEGARNTVILVSANVGGPPPADTGAAREDVEEIRVYALQYAAAEETTKVLQRLFADLPVNVVPDERANCLIVKGTRDMLQRIEALVTRLDAERD